MDDISDLVRVREEEFTRARSQYGRFSPNTARALNAWLEALNARAFASGNWYLREYALASKFDVDAPEPLLMRGNRTRLLLDPDPSDRDERPLCLEFEKCYGATFTPPTEELLPTSRLGGLGLGTWLCV
jgi:hypothetical protein